MQLVTTIITTITQELFSVYACKQTALNVAWHILEYSTHLTRTELVAKKAIILSSEQKQLIQDIISKHVDKHMPLAYIFGSVSFIDLDIIIRPPILIPRPETEQWCFWLIQLLKQLKNQKIKILDMCTGSGCIALALAYYLPKSTVYALDISQQACNLAQENKQIYNLANLHIIQSNLYNTLSPEIKFDLIISNPPYISLQEWHTLEPSVKDWEDYNALVSPYEGLELLKKIIICARTRLIYNSEFKKHSIPSIITEIGVTQGLAVKKLYQQAGFTSIIIGQDDTNRDRIVMAYLEQEI